jgi:hypothetical protein
MRNVIFLLLTVLGIVALGVIGGACLAAIPDLSPDALRTAATHVFSGEVLRIYSAVEQTSPEWETTYLLAEIEVAKSEKGEHEGKLAYVRFQTRRYTGPGQEPPGDYGHRGAPEVGDVVRVFVNQAEDGGFDVLAPNGFVTVP